MRIAYLTLEAPHEGQASYAHVNEIVTGLRRRGFVVELYQPIYTGRAKPPGTLRRLFEYVRLQGSLLLGWRRYDLIYVRSHFMAFPVALAARLTDRAIIHEINGPYIDIMVTYPWTRRFQGLLCWLERLQNRWADALVAVTPQLMRWLRAEGCMHLIEVIPNGANLTHFNPNLKRRPDLPEQYAVFFGGFARWQGITTMIDAVRHPAWPADVPLVIVGDGQMRPEVERAAANEKNLLYLGKLPYIEVGSVVVGALASLVPKIREKDHDDTGLFPVKLFEIMACGVPAIVTDYPGQADLVRSANCGLVVAPNDPEALAAAVAQVAADPVARKAMGQRGYRAVLESHSWDCRVQQTIELIRRVSGRVKDGNVGAPA